MAARPFWQAFGPGLLFAGAAVGVSHLVQSTRAGAVYGLALVAVVLGANLLKYPAFRFGPLYAAATGHSLLEGYRRQGRWALWLYGALTIGTMFTVQAAVTVVTAGLAKVLLGLSASPIVISAVLVAICAGLLAVGRYRLLDRLMKGVVAALTLSTLAAAALVVPQVSWGGAWWPTGEMLDLRSLFFIAALVGWMPSAIDVSVWQSLWVLARGRDAGQRPGVRDVMLDFNIGYFGTALLAFCFLILGAGVMHGRGAVFAGGAGGFAAQVIDLYAAALGDWARPVIGVCAFAVMFSTTLTVVDGFPRALAGLAMRLRGPEGEVAQEQELAASRRVYWLALVILAVGSVAVLALFIGALKAMVDLATTLSFLTAPVLAWLNHRAVHGAEVPAEHRPGPALRRGSLAAIALLSIFAAWYMWLRITAPPTAPAKPAAEAVAPSARQQPPAEPAADDAANPPQVPARADGPGHWLDAHGRPGTHFAEAWRDIAAVVAKGHDQSKLMPAERTRRAAVLAELRRGRPTLITVDPLAGCTPCRGDATGVGSGAQQQPAVK